MKKAELKVDKSGAEALETPSAEPLLPVEPSTLTAEQLEELKARAAKADEHWDRLLRTAADFENFKKRAGREKQDAIKYANEALIEKLLPVLDHFDMAVNAPQGGADAGGQSFQAGIAMVYEQLRKVLMDAGLQELNATGQKFDPNWHEAVSQEETTRAPEGHVLQQLRKGYKLHDRLLRPATVIVAKSPSEKSK